MPSFGDSLRAVKELKADGVILDYAIAEAMALVFWTEPVPTYDLDVLVLLPGLDRGLISLDAIYRWTDSRGYPTRDEHVIIEGLPVQFLPAPDALAHEAVTAAADVEYEGLTVRVARPEYLIALVPAASGPHQQEA